MRTLSGEYIFQNPANIKCSVADCKFCHDFVIESAIRIQDFDFDVDE
jgi:Pyruvate/2-oxoacid:ferredoxin oxidoreductase delta subunit